MELKGKLGQGSVNGLVSNSSSVNPLPLPDMEVDSLSSSEATTVSEQHYSKGNNNSENQIPRQEIFKPVDHGCEVRRSGQVTTSLVCTVFSLSKQC